MRLTLTEAEEALLGMGMLAGCTLFIDCDTGAVRIERKPSGGEAQSVPVPRP